MGRALGAAAPAPNSYTAARGGARDGRPAGVSGRPNNVECMLATRNIRMRLIALVGDIVALRITGTLNGDIHATIGEPQLGVLFTRCRKCGGGVMLKRDVVKCVECGWVDERKLSSDYGKAGFIGLP